MSITGIGSRSMISVQSLVDSGQLKTPLTWEQLVEPRLVDGAMAELGPYQRS
jgi:hypothetical protein